MIVLAADYVGYRIVQYLCEQGECIRYLVLDSYDRGGYNAKMTQLVSGCICLSEVDLLDTHLRKTMQEEKIGLGILAWWPYILDEELLSIPQKGFINTHPSYLPYNRGKHPYFWSIVEGTPFGVTLHYADIKIDHGPIIAQRQIPITWEDTGKTLYEKSRETMVQLFADSYNYIKDGDCPKAQLQEQEGTFHWGKELELHCCINLDDRYTARELLNICRGRMFSKDGEAYFIEEGVRYRVGVRITREN